MLEVGQIMDPKTKELDIPWNQAHFGAWCVVASPLTLGLNLRSPELPKIIPFITNKEAVSLCHRQLVPPVRSVWLTRLWGL